MPVAENCLVVPSAMLGLVGETWIDCSIAEVTASVVLPRTTPDAAVIMTEPGATEVAKPPEATVAMPESDEFQVTDPVKSWFVPSE